MLFFDEARTEAHALLDGLGYVHTVDAPRPGQSRNTPAGSQAGLPAHLLFEIALSDTNEDGRINASDRRAFYLSDYAGTNLRQITPDSLSLDTYWYAASGAGIFFEHVQVGPTERVYGVEYTRDVRRLYFYDFQRDTLEVHSALQDAFDQVVRTYLHADS